MWREITRLKEMNDSRTREAGDQSEKLKGLDFDLARTQARIEDTQKLLDVRSSDLRAKQLALEDAERELARLREDNSKLGQENALLRRDNDRVAAENYDLRKEVDFQEGRNADVSIQIRDTELRLKEKEDNLFASRRDVEALRIQSSQGRTDNGDLLAERDALEKHAGCLQNQNDDLTRELERFCETDEVLRGQLDRRFRVHGLQSKNNDEIRHSYSRVD